jgi:hypothetical protein
VRFRVMMSVEIEAADYRQAHAHALKLLELLKGPLVKMAVESEGIRLSGDGRPIVHQPQRELR